MNKGKSKFDMILEIAAILILLSVGIYIFLKWADIPNIIPTHFGADGLPYQYGSKSNIFVFYGMSVAIYGAMWLCQGNPRAWRLPIKLTEEQKERNYPILKTMVIGIKTELMAILAYCIICIINIRPMGQWLLTGSLILVFGTVAIGLYLYKRK